MRYCLQLLKDSIYNLFYSSAACSGNGHPHTWSEMFLKILGKTWFFSGPKMTRNYEKVPSATVNTENLPI